MPGVFKRIIKSDDINANEYYFSEYLSENEFKLTYVM